MFGKGFSKRKNDQRKRIEPNGKGVIRYKMPKWPSPVLRIFK
jgi:hypothetical protein